jgi:hypothetical protein
VAGNYESKELQLKLRLNNDAIEPFINAGNYRVTHYVKSTKEDDDEFVFRSEMAEGLSNVEENIVFSTVDLSDSVAGCRIQLPSYLSSNTIFLSWFPVSTIRDLKGGFPIRLLGRIHTSRFTDFYDSESWSKLETAKNDELFYPVSPSYQIPDSIVDVDKVIYSACDNSDVVTETVLVEEYDGHTWRKILGDAPYNGIEAEDVLITDSIPLGFEFVSFVGDSTGATYEATPDADISSGIVRYRADKLKIGEKGSFGYKCRYTGPVSGGSYVTSAIMESKNEKVKSTMHLIVDDLSSVKQTVNEDGDAPVDVYNAQGQLLKRQVSPDQALEGLSKGVYMVGNKKKVVTK